jgi:hypothetical protein
MQPDEKRVWFRAKRYGWGWGLPCAWQGWVAMAIWLALLVGGAALLLPGGHFGLWLAWVAALAVALIVLGFVKGEPPRWRWGED